MFVIHYLIKMNKKHELHWAPKKKNRHLAFVAIQAGFECSKKTQRAVQQATAEQTSHQLQQKA